MRLKRDFQIHRVDWQQGQGPLREIRVRVFIEEQNVPAELEWDDMDAPSQHFLAVDADGCAIGCARLLPDAHIGRMAVLPEWRGRGVGSALLQAALQAALEQGFTRVALSAQVHALPFYERAGFVAHGPEYIDAGIPHRDMALALTPEK